MENHGNSIRYSNILWRLEMLTHAHASFEQMWLRRSFKSGDPNHKMLVGDHPDFHWNILAQNRTQNCGKKKRCFLCIENHHHFLNMNFSMKVIGDHLWAMIQRPPFIITQTQHTFPGLGIEKVEGQCILELIKRLTGRVVPDWDIDPWKMGQKWQTHVLKPNRIGI